VKNCNRFEEEGLEKEVLPTEFADHLQTCPDCQQAQKSYESLCQLLRHCQLHMNMPPAWQEGVWRSIEQGEGAKETLAARVPAQPKPSAKVQVPTQPKPSLWEQCCTALRAYRWTLGGAVTAALAALLVVYQQMPSPTASDPSAFEWSILDVATSQIRSADSAKLGNQIHIKAQVPPAAQAALFVYLQNQLVFSCSLEKLGQHCQQDDNTLKAQVPLEHLGHYRALWVVSSKPLSIPQAGFDVDAANFLREGANIQHPFTIEVY